jgi:hypothetical protein
LDAENSNVEREFQQLKAQHIYRDFNKEVDKLSKEALVLDENGLYVAGNTDGGTKFFERLQYS